ncbi:MAG: leucine-rich repeat protein [Lachnospiraceae bacterium]|nr:leucine-rich repeat protein [Lachnospiraceae bacterium]
MKQKKGLSMLLAFLVSVSAAACLGTPLPAFAAEETAAPVLEETNAVIPDLSAEETAWTSEILTEEVDAAQEETDVFYADTSGSCGPDLAWVYDETAQSLTITGSGSMTDYASSDKVPWYTYRKDITTVSIDSRVTTISAYSFYEFKAAAGAFPIPAGVTAIGKYAFYASAFTADSLTLPAAIKKVSEYSFYQCKGIKKLIIPAGVTEIEKFAFRECSSIDSLTLPASLTTIGESAFQKNTSLKALTIPDGVTTIGKNAFETCDSLTGDLELPKSLQTMGDYAFQYCSGLNGKLIIRSGALKKIPYKCFDDCSFDSISLPAGLKSIGEQAFADTKAASVVIPQLVTEIASNAFTNTTNLTAIYFRGNVPATLSTDTGTLGSSAVKLYYLADRTGWTASLNGHTCTQVEESAIPANDNSTEVLADMEPVTGSCGTSLSYTITGNLAGETLTITGSGDMNDYNDKSDVPWYDHRDAIVKVVVPDGLTGIGKYAFFELNSVSGSFPIPSSVETIGQYAFNKSEFSQATLTLPENLNTLGNYAFAECRGIGIVTVPGTAGPTVGDRAFSKCANMTELTIGKGVTAIGEYACDQNKMLKKVTIDGSVKKIGKGAFHECVTLSNLTLGTGIKEIQEDGFRKCSSLRRLMFPEGLQTIGKNAFEYCTGLTGDLTLPTSLQTMGDYAFQYCSGLTGTLTMNCSKLTAIPYKAFDETKFEKVILPPALQSIDDEAFCDITADHVVFPATLTRVDAGAFRNAPYLEKVYFRGDAPETGSTGIAANASSSKTLGDPAKVTLYYISGKEGWSNPMWGYNTAACAESDIPDDGGDVPAVVPVTGVTFSAKTLSLAVGATGQLSWTISPTNATDPSVSFVSDKPAVAMVDTAGKVTGVTPGQAVITVTTTDGGKTDTCEVTVTDSTVVVESVTLTPSTLPLKVGETGRITAAVTPAAAVTTYSFVSDTPAVATVSGSDAAAVVTAVKAGTAIITVTTANNKTATCAVTVTDNDTPEPGPEPIPPKAHYTVEFYSDVTGTTERLQSVSVVAGDAVDFPDAPEVAGFRFAGWCVDSTEGRMWDETAPVFADMDLHARYLKDDETDDRHSGLDPDLAFEEESDLYVVKGQKFNFPDDYIWTSADKTIVKIANKYKATAQKAGKTTVTGTKTAESGDPVTLTYVVYVTAPKLVVKEPTAQEGKTVMQLVEGNPGALKLTGMSVTKHDEVTDKDIIEDATDEYDITWISSNVEVARVDEGMVYAVSKGTSKVTAYLNGKAYTVTVKVTDIYGISEYESAITLTPLQTVTVKYKKDKTFKLNAKTVWSSSAGMKTVTNKQGKVVSYDDPVVRVTPAGKLTAIGVGSSVLTATDVNNNKKSFKVTVKNIEAKTIHINKGKSKNIKFYGMKFTGQTAAVGQIAAEYQSIIGFAGTGAKLATIRALAPGKAKVVYVYDPYGTGGFIYNVNVYVEEPELTVGTELKLKRGSSYTLDLKKGKNFVLELPKVYQSVVFTSNKNAVAFVDEMGVIQGRAKGKATLTGKVNGTKITIAVTVAE